MSCTHCIGFFHHTSKDNYTARMVLTSNMCASLELALSLTLKREESPNLDMDGHGY